MPPDHDLDEALRDVRAALLELIDDETPVATSPQLADRLNRDRRRVHDDLERLQLLDAADSLQAGAHARVWWPEPHPWRDTHADSAPHSEPPGAPVGDERPPQQQRGQEPHVQDVVDDLRAALRRDLPTRGKDLDEIDAMLEAVAAAAEYLRANGEAGATELQESLYGQHSGPYGSNVSWYKKCIKPGLSVLDDDGRLPIEAPTGAGQPWRWNS
jgi:hypothetical protein